MIASPHSVNTSELAISAQRLPQVPERVFQGGTKTHYRVRIFITGPSQELDKLTAVRYLLHPTFRQRERVATDRHRGFEIQIWTWGYFPITANLIARDGTEFELEGYVRFK